MRFKNQVRTLLGATALLASSVPGAATISYNGYSHDDSTNIVVGGGVEWLQWDETQGVSIASFLAGDLDGTIGTGWSLASNTQMATLFNAFAFGPTYGNDETVFYSGTSPYSNPATFAYVDIFGFTSNFSFGESDGPVKITTALYGEDLDSDGFYNRAYVREGYLSKGSPRDGEATLFNDAEPVNQSTYSLALVRDVSAVPLPPAVGLFVAGLLGLGFAGRRKVLKP